MRKFHHHKVLNIVIGIIAYAQLTLIICGSIALMIDIFKNGAPTSFGIYG
jgi:hypothetical protein